MKIKSIKFSSRASVKHPSGSWFTFEYEEVVDLDENDDVNQCRNDVIDRCNKVVDSQIEEILLVTT